jgi:heme o synthase
MSYLIATPKVIGLEVVLLSLGGILVTCAASVLNQVLERDFDKLMNRTANRPLATGRMKIGFAVMVAGLMSLVGITLLSALGPLTAFLGTISLILYAFVYTPLKRETSLAVAVGAIPGALPTMIGAVVAANDSLSSWAILLFSVQFLWQFAHFYAIAWLTDEDYKRAGFRLLPGDGEKTPYVGMMATGYTALLIPLTFLPVYLGITGWVPVVLAQLVNLAYLAYSLQFYRFPSKETARKLMFFSFAHLPLVLLALLAHRLF